MAVTDFRLWILVSEYRDGSGDRKVVTVIIEMVHEREIAQEALILLKMIKVDAVN